MAKAVTRTVQSVDRAVGILDVLSARPDGLKLKDLAGRVGLAVQTAQSLLRTLEAHELVAQGGRGEPYVLGPGVHRLSRRWMEHRNLPAMARRAVADLAAATGESVLLAELRGGALVGMVEVSPRRSLMVRPELESAERLHTMATAKVLLAFQAEARREEIIASMDFARHGPKSATSAAEFRRHVRKVRADGHAVCVNEAAEGVGALAVPICDEAGGVVAALGTSVPLTRFAPARRKVLLAEMLATRDRIEAAWFGGA